MIFLYTAETAGFCFGVKRAMTMVDEALLEYGKVYTLGSLINNKLAMDELKVRGVHIINASEEANGVIIIRSHGISKAEYGKIIETGKPYRDATCPFVQKIHETVEQYATEENVLVVIGNKDHPEVKGIVGYAKGRVVVIDSEQELTDFVNSKAFSCDIPLIVVVQTTFDICKLLEYKKIIKKHYTNVHFFDTICRETLNRQQEAEKLSKKCQIMIVVGDKLSSNTGKLVEICKKNAETFFIQSAKDIDCHKITAAIMRHGEISMDVEIGITAGASTPAGIIKEVHKVMSEIIKNDDTDIDFMAEVDKTFKRVYIGNRVKACVVAVHNTEAVVDIGTKHAGYIPSEELSANSSLLPKDVVKVGDVIDCIVTSINDAEGVVYLSKKKVDATVGFEKILAARDNNATLMGTVSSVVKGGVIIMFEGARVFIPASQSGVPKVGKLEDLLKKEVGFKVIEVNEARGRVVGSIRLATKETSDALKAKFWETIEIGQKFTGEIKSMESYGVFVDLGGVDGMVHTSELTWNRIKHPKDIVSIGDKLDVYVKGFDLEKKRVSLGAKDPNDNPWAKFLAEFKVNDVINVQIVSFTPFGAFAQIIPGVDGLIHISQISTERITNVAQALTLGQIVEVRITEIDEEKSRVSLSMKALIEEAAAYAQQDADIAAANDEAAEQNSETATEQ